MLWRFFAFVASLILSLLKIWLRAFGLGFKLGAGPSVAQVKRFRKG